MRGGGAENKCSRDSYRFRSPLYSILITFWYQFATDFGTKQKTWWMLKSAPVTPRLVFTSKFLDGAVSAPRVYAEFWSLIVIYLLRIPRDSWIPVLLIPILTLPAGLRSEYNDR